MNAFEYIDEMIEQITVQTNVDNKDLKNTSISLEQHYNEMFNMLDILRKEMENAEYNYVVKGVDTEIITFEELTVFKKQLQDDVIIFQPIAIGEEELSAIDMQNLGDVLTQLRDNGIIKENMLLLPPNINVFKAKLVK